MGTDIYETYMTFESLVQVVHGYVFLLLRFLGLELFFILLDRLAKVLYMNLHFSDEFFCELRVLIRFRCARVLHPFHGLLAHHFEEAKEHPIVSLLQLGGIISWRAVRGWVCLEASNQGVEVDWSRR